MPCRRSLVQTSSNTAEIASRVAGGPALSGRQASIRAASTTARSSGDRQDFRSRTRGRGRGGGRGGGRGPSQYAARKGRGTASTAAELLAQNQRLGLPANKTFVRSRPSWMPSDPLHDPASEAELDALVREKRSLWSRMATLNAFDDVESYREASRSLQGVGASSVIDVSEEEFQEIRRQYNKFMAYWERHNAALIEGDSWDSKVALERHVLNEDAESRNADARWVYEGEMPDFRNRRPEGFSAPPAIDTRVLQVKRTTNMKRAGRRNMMNVLAIAGNGDGAAGFALAKSLETQTATEKAMALARKRMVAIERRNGHTIHHEVNAKFVSTRVFMQYAPRGHGLVCHRAIWEICRVAGIQDLIANVRGSVTPLNVVRAAFMCFEKQSQNLLLERSAATGKTALEYDSLQLMPRIAVAAPTVGSRDSIFGAETQQPLAPTDVQAITESWLHEFPLRPNASNFAFARLVRHGLLLQQLNNIRKDPTPEAITDAIDRVRTKHTALLDWLKAIPAGAELSFGPMYPLVAETLQNCEEFPEFEHDDDALIYHEEIEHALADDRV